MFEVSTPIQRGQNIKPLHRHILAVAFFLLVFVYIGWDVYEFIVPNRGVEYYRDRPEHLLIVIGLAWAIALSSDRILRRSNRRRHPVPKPGEEAEPVMKQAAQPDQNCQRTNDDAVRHGSMDAMHSPQPQRWLGFMRLLNWRGKPRLIRRCIRGTGGRSTGLRKIRNRGRSL